MLDGKQQMILVPSNFGIRAYVLLANSCSSHAQVFCAAGDSRSLAINVTMSQVSWGKLGDFIAPREQQIIVFMAVSGLPFKLYTLKKKLNSVA
jgi:hypothetical protein